MAQNTSEGPVITMTGLTGGQAENVKMTGIEHNYYQVRQETIPGTIGDKRTHQRMKSAKKEFVSTKTYKVVKSKLDQYGHVTICGASGEGKTTMSLMLAGEYQQKDYHIVFVDNIDKFDLSECLKLESKQFLIFDDIFGSAGLSTNIVQLRSMLLSLRQCIDEKSERSKQSSDIRMVFTSKTYNFNNVGPLLQHESLYLFKRDSLVDLTIDSCYRYSKDERVDIFNHYNKMCDYAQMVSVSEKDIYDISDTLFGFPMTCRLFFSSISFAEKGIKFFDDPIHYLTDELETILKKKNDQSAALALMVLCDNIIKLPEFELSGQNQTMDDMFKCLSDMFPSLSRDGVCNAARDFVGTYFTGTDVLQFTHSSIFDAFASALCKANNSFLLKYCSYDFVFERIKSHAVSNANADSPYNDIIVTKAYFDLIASRLCEAMRHGLFTKSVTHTLLNEESVVNKILEKLVTHASSETTDWIHGKDQGRGFLYWAVQGHSSLFVRHVERLLKVTFSQPEIDEALTSAVERDKLSLLEFFLKKVLQERHHETISRLLLESAKHESHTTAEYMLKAGADVSKLDPKHQNSFHITCYYGNVKVLRLLMSKLENWQNNERISLFTSVDKKCRTPVMLAAWSGSRECFDLVKRETNTDMKDKHGSSLLHLACQGGNLDIVKQLINTTNINSTGRYGLTPLMRAAMKGVLNVFDCLVANHADITMIDKKSNNLLHLACHGGNTAIIEQLLSIFDINSIGQDGWTPVMFAVMEGHQRAFELLESKNADLKLKSVTGDSLLHLACRGGNKSTVQQLVSSTNINNKGNHGWTPIMVAAKRGHLGIYEILFSNNADLTLVSESRDTLLHLACQGGNVSIVKKLVTITNIDGEGRHNWTPIMKATVHAHLDVFEFLVSKDADLNLKSNVGDSLLHLACQGGNSYIIKKLLCPSNINVRGQNEWTPIMFAVVYGRQSVFKFMLSKEADCTLLDDYGNNLLHLSCRGGNKDIVEKLLPLLNINSTDQIERTPAIKAALYGHLEVLKLLEEHKADLSMVDKEGDDIFSIAKEGRHAHIVEYLSSA